jgi:hypothetical protein
MNINTIATMGQTHPAPLKQLPSAPSLSLVKLQDDAPPLTLERVFCPSLAKFTLLKEQLSASPKGTHPCVLQLLRAE